MENNTIKCGIITIHNVANYGATFQALGLLEYLNSQEEIEAEFIDYRMNQTLSNKCYITNPKFRYIRKLNKILNLKRHIDIKVRGKKFEVFWKKMFRYSQASYSGDEEFFAAPPTYDYYISGSDQIFNLELTNMSKAYFFAGLQGKKLSYSTSFGMAGLKKQYIPEVKEYLNDYQAVSVRELSVSKEIENELLISNCVTVDPVFLLNRDDWSKLCTPIRVPKKYIFCYIMSDNPNLAATLSWLQKNQRLPVIVMQTCKGNLGINGKRMNNLGPDEFLYLISHAEYVLTNSFHGCALSFIFGRKLFSLEEERYIGDKRYEALFGYSGVIDKIVPHDTDWQTFDFAEHLIDGEEAYNRLESWIEESKLFLMSNLTRR